MKNTLFIALGAGFLLFGVAAYIQSEPAARNKQVSQEVKKYSPYYLEKRFGGLQIRKKGDEEFKEKPDNMQVFHRMDELEQKWGKSHLTLKQSKLLVKDDNGTILNKIPLRNKKEIEFVHSFYGI